MVLACCVIRDRPRASKKSLRVPRTIQAESAPRPLTARSTFRGRCSRATSKRKPRKYISTSRSLNVETLVRRTFVVENILLLNPIENQSEKFRSWRDETLGEKGETKVVATAAPPPPSPPASFSSGKRRKRQRLGSTRIDQRRG